MNRLTRFGTQLNSLESRRFVVTATVKLHLRRLNHAPALKNHEHCSTPLISFGIFSSKISDRPRLFSRLPENLSRNVVVLTCKSADGGICHVHLVGTKACSQESCREVQAVISYLKPQVVFLELCSSRELLRKPLDFKVPTMGEMVEKWKKNHYAFAKHNVYAEVADKFEVFPGSEFRTAYEEAMKYGGKVILGDRPVQITLRRTWAKIPLRHMIKSLYYIFQSFFLPSPEELTKMLKNMEDPDMVTQKLSKEFPTLADTLVHERDHSRIFWKCQRKKEPLLWRSLSRSSELQSYRASTLLARTNATQLNSPARL